ncbi:MAG: energy transducer TonB [Myxococcales bacterium]|nr:energy transducer TonB [Myxococcales bacterium]
MRAPSLVLAALLLAACGPSPGTRGPGPIEHKPPPDDPRRPSAGPDDGMEVEGMQGTLDDDEVARVVSEQMAGFRNCFRRAPGAFVAGEVLLQFVVAPNGRVDKVWVAQSDLGSWAVEDCLVQTARFLEFPRPMGGGPARFVFPFGWNERARRLTAPIDEAWGYETLRKGRGAIDACREQHGFAGPFHVTAYVGRKGHVMSAGLHAPKPAGDFAACAVTALGEMGFPNPGSRIVKYQALVEDLPDAP